MRKIALTFLIVLLAAAPLLAEEHDDCDAKFINFVGANAYQFSPEHEGDLGAIRLFSILSYQRAAHARRFGWALWKLEIVDARDGKPVLTTGGRGRIDAQGATMAEFYWDGRDNSGQLVPAGTYRYTFRARYRSDVKPRVPLLDYDRATDVEPADEAIASTDELVVNYSLTPDQARNLRVSINATTCQVQQNSPLELGFAYSFFYGSTHAHSNWSDGGQPTGSCSSGNAYGSGTFSPTDVFAFARDQAGLDFWVVNDHNHLIQDAIATNDPPVTEAKVRQRYQDGLSASNAVTTSSFVGIYGMEWGVTSNADQGHVTLLETPVLLGWETCTTCNGPSIECTPGTNCYFDVFTPKRYNYLTLYQRSVENPSPAGALGILNHPSSGEFDNLAFNADADNAIQGIAVRSGLAFSTATDCGIGNVGATDYSGQFRQALNRGFHVAPTADHDSHCNNYGVALPTRTVYLAPSLSKANLLAAHRARRFFATEDPNLQLVFRTGDSAHVMGEIFNVGSSVNLVANVYDPDGEATSTIELWRGQAGTGAPSTPYQTWSSTSSASFNEAPGTGTYWYYVRVVQADGHDAWSAPMWITFGGGGGGGDTQAPTASITAPASGATVSGTAFVTATASDDTGVTRVEFRLDGTLQSTDTTAPYEWSWNTTTASEGSHTLVATAFDAAGNSGASAGLPVTVSNGGVPGTGSDVSGWKVVQANSAYEYVIPAGTTIPAEGYLVIARNATKAAFETFWGRTLGSNTVFLNAADTMPVINGSETYSLYNAASVLVEGPTIAMASGAAQSIRRADPCGAASVAASWTVGATSLADPGAGAAAGCGGGVKINEFADATGTGNYIYEFVELHNDSGTPADTQAPSTSLTAPASGATVSGSILVTATASDNTAVSRVEFFLDGTLASTDTTAPYEWTWDTLTATNASHSLQSKAYDAADNVGSSTIVSVTVSNDTTAPTTAITAPAAGATVSGTVSVTASASDNVGVSRVEFFLDGTLQSTDTTSPYSWSWTTTGVANGAHTLQSKAYDAAGNAGSSANVSVTVNNVTGTSLTGWRITQANATLSYTFGAGISIPSKGFVIVARNATKAQFEAYWGVTLGANVVFINSGDTMPQINGSETYTLYNASGTKADGATVAMASAAGESLQRKSGCSTANKAASWNRLSSSSGTPGTSSSTDCGKGIFISEFSDAAGTGNHIYEFIELRKDN